MQEDPPPSTYWLTRFFLLRLLGLVYLIAFLGAVQQNDGLLGSDGLTPIPAYLELVRSHYGSQAFLHVPTLFLFGYSDVLLSAVEWTGLGLSVLVLGGYANSVVMLVLWALYLSLVHVGQDWYGFGWESQLCETGFLAIFLCPLLDGRPFSRTPPSVVVIWLYRWLGFRIMLGSGLIKLRGDLCWRELTCLDWFFETQPIPNPLSWYAHHLPRVFLHAGVLANHFVELIVPWFSFGPRRLRWLAGVLMIAFQAFLILTGNLAFLNWLTIVPFLACLDDGFWTRLWPGLERHVQAAEEARKDSWPSLYTARALAILVALLSVGPVLNLLSSQQAMNTSFDPLELVNTYGAFGSVGQERNEIVLEGTSEDRPGPTTRWKEYEFRAKPGNPDRRPAILMGYHLRLDWLMWFAAMGEPSDYPWIYPLVQKLLANDPHMLALLGRNPFSESPPRFIRARLYRYRFSEGPGWWSRTLAREWLPPLRLQPHP